MSKGDIDASVVFRPLTGREMYRQRPSVSGGGSGGMGDTANLGIYAGDGTTFCSSRDRRSLRGAALVLGC